ncbi:MAG TPA: RNase adapter RapZ [Thermodesulfobacteriota bacterium]|nr:RNase adapter RapZ [Thermodesulfobacteriota bacterium]
MRVVVVTGLSGAGKSTAIRALEDLGFFCVDNLPVTLVPHLLEVCRTGGIGKVALGIDVREREFLAASPRTLETLRAAGYRIELLFLEASDEALIRRFSETRRRHPLAQGESVVDGIRRERELLADLKSLADQILDTSLLTVHQLRGAIQERYLAAAQLKQLTVTLLSFGFRYGLPPEADLVVDVRFLRNPHFVEEFRDFDGSRREVAQYVLESPEAAEFLRRFEGLLAFLLPLYEKEGKAYVTVAVGCTGGQHRSVAVVLALADRLDRDRYLVRVRHRDLGRGRG